MFMTVNDIIVTYVYIYTHIVTYVFLNTEYGGPPQCVHEAVDNHTDLPQLEVERV
jgi:hypothetical protein